MTLKDTPTIVTAAGVAGLEFTDEVATANALVPVLRAQGRQGDRRAHPPGRHPVVQKWLGPDGKTYDANATYDYTCGKGGTPDRRTRPILPIAARASTRRSTWSSPATPTSPTSATSPTPRASSAW